LEQQMIADQLFNLFAFFSLGLLPFPFLSRQSFPRLQPAANRIEFLLQLDVFGIRSLYV
jgi:hypothetical protein